MHFEKYMKLLNVVCEDGLPPRGHLVLEVNPKDSQLAAKKRARWNWMEATVVNMTYHFEMVAPDAKGCDSLWSS